MYRQRKFREMVSNMCVGCPFCDRDLACVVPGGTCVWRRVMGVPGRFVGDVLQNAGLINGQWEEHNLLRESLQLGEIEDKLG